MDRFSCSYNAKLLRFNSRFFQEGLVAVDALSQVCPLDSSWLLPPTSLIGKVLNHMRDGSTARTLVLPMWKSAHYWTLSCNDGVHLNSFTVDWKFLPSRPDLFEKVEKGRAKNTLYDTKPLKSRFLAVRVDFRSISRFSNFGFCMSSLG